MLKYLRADIAGLHVARRYTLFFDILPDDTIGVFEVTTIEEALKRYKCYRN